MPLPFDHIALASRNIAETIEYYKFEFPETAVLFQDESWALLDIGGLRLAFVKEDEHPPHLAFRIASRRELEAAAHKLGIAVSLHRDGSESLYTQDPSGNAIEIIFYPDH